MMKLYYIYAFICVYVCVCLCVCEADNTCQRLSGSRISFKTIESLNVNNYYQKYSYNQRGYNQVFLDVSL